MTVALHIWSIHHRRLAGTACEYNEVVMRWMKCMVRAKSSTSFDRAIKRTIKMTLSQVSFAHEVSLKVCLPYETVKHPYQPQGPANCGIAAQTAPVE